MGATGLVRLKIRVVCMSACMRLMMLISSFFSNRTPAAQSAAAGRSSSDLPYVTELAQPQCKHPEAASRRGSKAHSRAGRICSVSNRSAVGSCGPPAILP